MKCWNILGNSIVILWCFFQVCCEVVRQKYALIFQIQIGKIDLYFRFGVGGGFFVAVYKLSVGLEYKLFVFVGTADTSPSQPPRRQTIQQQGILPKILFKRQCKSPRTTKAYQFRDCLGCSCAFFEQHLGFFEAHFADELHGFFAGEHL